ncbi:MAG: quinone-dependent dihydroorotate dehydrogenase [Verrucomicrobiota bacterium]
MINLYQNLLRPLFFLLDPERVHHISLAALSKTPIARFISPWTSLLESDPIKLWGITFPNRIGLAAGFDKNAEALPAWPKLGFGHVELGTVTCQAQPGNPKPRIFRIASHQGLINRMGFPNNGANAIATKLQRYKQNKTWPSIPVGINIGKSKVTEIEEAAEDYLESFQKLRPYADYIAINVSSPNTPGLRSLQEKDQLLKILKILQKENKKDSLQDTKEVPILVKIAPDLEKQQIMEVLDCIQDADCDGIIATNTTIDHSKVRESINEKGGLSGSPARVKSTQVIRFISRETQGKLPIIGVGGIFNQSDAREKLDAGASLLQAYTGFIYEGPTFCRVICER